MLKLSLVAAIVLTSFALNAQAQNPASAPDAMASPKGVIKLVFLGTGAPRPSEERHGASILVEAGKRKFLIDAGPGVRERVLQAGGFDLLTGITDVFVTHIHYDHVANIVDLWITGWMYGRKIPLHVYGPSGTANFIDHIRKAYDWDMTYREIVGIPPTGDKIIAKDVTPGVIFNEDGIKITAFHVAHMPIDPATGKPGKLEGDTFGYRVDYAGRSAVFSGDGRSLPGSDLIKYGRGADVLVHEVQVPSPGNSPEAIRANVSLAVHSSPEQAAFVFSQTMPRMAVYSHIIPPQTTSEELSKDTRPFYKGPLTTAFDLMTLTIGDQIEIGKRESHAETTFEHSDVVK